MLTPKQMDNQFAASLIGPMNVARAVLPVMRQQRSGHIISISSSAGLAAGLRSTQEASFITQGNERIDPGGAASR